ncbi:peptide deformylase [Candidatus Nardonella dryophthoridicola]|uniref:peptide deformylase n=1 Tax=Candidatus Nardonella dryophthoridicola TaxID=1971485 RepID=UPI001AD85DDC|nr:peptide deformylase [Candidatus Nardonella dryophthoridicola]QTJ62873.1 peptide deformylase [Candidatus Nardonella dryophthoridicola]
MNILKIIKFPSNILRKKSKKVNKNTNKKIILDIKNKLFNTMYYNKGIGLSAIQVNIDLNIIVYDVNNIKNFMINSEIIYKNENIYSYEGCLSIPNIYYEVKRYKNIIVKYEDIDRNINILKIENNNLLSSCIQHEIDHTNGILFIDYLSNIKKFLINKKIKKNNKHY